MDQSSLLSSNANAIELTLNETGHSFAVVQHEFLGKLSHESAGEGEVFAVFPTIV